MNWWENGIDGHSLEWQNHESDNSILLEADLNTIPNLVEDHYEGKILGICKNPPGSVGPFGGEQYAICFEDGNGDLRWFHILKDQFLLWTGK